MRTNKTHEASQAKAKHKRAITIRPSPKLRRELVRMARTEQRSVAKVIEFALTKYLEERKTA
jgi:predicted transcriptional regulator